MDQTKETTTASASDGEKTDCNDDTLVTETVQIVSASNNNATTISSPAASCSNKSKALSADAPVFYPKNFLPELANMDVLTINDDQQSSNGTYDCINTRGQPKYNENVLGELREAIQIFNNDPGHFEQIMPSLARRLASMMSSGDCSSMPVIEEIFNQSIDEVNFRYTGARMCNYLSHCNEQAFCNFQHDFLSRCEKEHEKIMSLQPTLTRVIGYSLFIGELLLNMKDVTSNKVIPQFPKQISQLLMYLLNNHSKEALMCTVQLLKLTGAVLEENLLNLDEIFDKMNTIVNEQTLPQNVLCLMQSVMNQRLNRWGQHTNHTNEPFISAGAGDSFDSPIDENPINNLTDHELYNGNSFSSDEREMASLMEECNEQGLLDQYWIGDQKMDNETATAFEQFMAESQIAANNMQQQQQNQGNVSDFNNHNNGRVYNNDYNSHRNNNNDYNTHRSNNNNDYNNRYNSDGNYNSSDHNNRDYNNHDYNNHRQRYNYHNKK